MKVAKLMNAKLLSGLLLVILLMANACKKNNEKKFPKSLMGGWNETGLSANASRSLRFYGDSVAFNNAVSGIVFSLTKISGTYKVKGDSLLFNFSKQFVMESGKQSYSTPYTGKLYERATYKVDGNTLTLKYITYPADAPVATTAIFLKNSPD